MAKNKEIAGATPDGKAPCFRWRYVVLPLTLLILSSALAAVFYNQLPAEVAYRFQADGSPDGWLSRSTVILWATVPHLILALLAGFIAWATTLASRRSRQAEEGGLNPESIIILMGNMVALPQAILFFAMLDIFSYNAYQIHILSLWANALIVMGLGGSVFGIFFIRAMRRIWSASR